MTEYLVLKKIPAKAGDLQGDTWQPIKTVDAVSSDAAIKAMAETVGTGEYVAVPARSWQPKKIIEVKQVVEVKFA